MEYKKLNQIPLNIKKESLLLKNKNFINNYVEQIKNISFWKNFFTWFYLFINLFLIINYIILLIIYYSHLPGNIPIIFFNNKFVLYPKVSLFLILSVLIFGYFLFFYTSYKTYYKVKGMYFLSHFLGIAFIFFTVLDVYKIIQMSL